MSTLNGITFFGNNEDFSDPKTNIWFIPAQGKKYGYVYFSYDNGWPQGGMNDQGLCFDGASTPRVDLTFPRHKKKYSGNLADKIMQECATVEDVLRIIKIYRFDGLSHQGQLLFADKNGDAVILGGPDENKNLDIIRKDKNTMVLTNFFPRHPEMGGYPCLRYKSVTHHFEKDPRPNRDNFRTILEAVSSRYTQYSNIFDLQNRVIFLYHQADFSKQVQLKLEHELEKGAHSYRIHHLFMEPRSGESVEELNQQRAKGKISRRLPVYSAYSK